MKGMRSRQRGAVLVYMAAMATVMAMMVLSESARQVNELFDIGKIGMNARNKNLRKAVAYMCAIFFFSAWAGFSQAQPKQKPPSQKDFDALNAALKNMPTPQQNTELSKITDEYQKKYAPLNTELDKLTAEVERVTQSSAPNYLITKAHVQAAIINHKKLRALYVEHFDAVADWGRRSGRASCARQAEKTRLYMMRVSDQWLAKVAVLPLGTASDRAYAGLYMAAGGDMTFQPDLDPAFDTKYTVDTALIGLYAVCGGGKEEYIPGAE